MVKSFKIIKQKLLVQSFVLRFDHKRKVRDIYPKADQQEELNENKMAYCIGKQKHSLVTAAAPQLDTVKVMP